MKWLAIKTFLKKAWVWLKQYWYIPALLIVGLVVFIFARKKIDSIWNIFETSRDSYEGQIEAINKAHEEEKERLEEESLKYEAILKELKEKYDIEIEKLKKKEKEKIKEIMEEYKDNPSDMAKRMAKEFGGEYYED